MKNTLHLNCQTLINFQWRLTVLFEVVSEFSESKKECCHQFSMYTLYTGGTGQLFADPLHLLGIENEIDKCLNMCDIKYIITNAEKWNKYLTLKATVYVIKLGTDCKS